MENKTITANTAKIALMTRRGPLAFTNQRGYVQEITSHDPTKAHPFTVISNAFNRWLDLMKVFA